MLQFFRPRYMPSWLVFMKFKWMLVQRNMSVWTDSHAALKAFQAATTTSPFVRECQKAFNDISPGHTVGTYWVPVHAGVRGNEISDKLARDGSVQKFVGPETSLRVSTQNIKRTIKRWVDNQHLARWCGLVQEQGSLDPISDYGLQGACFKA